MADTFHIAILGTRFGEPDIEREILSDFQIQFTLDSGHTSENIVKNAKDAEIILAGGSPKFTAHVIRRLPKCRGIIRLGIGVDTVDKKIATEQGIIIANVPNYATEEVSDHAIALILASMRKLFQAHRSISSGNWGIKPISPLFSASDQTLGIIGFGKIGPALARKIFPMGFKLLVHDPFAEEETVSRQNAKMVSCAELLKQSDIITLNAPLLDTTFHLINAESIETMKRTAFLINTSRGELIDESALIAALKSGRIAGAALDVFEKEPLTLDNQLLTLDNVILTPHISWYTLQATKRMRIIASQEAARLLNGKRPLNLVNPEVFHEQK